MSEKCYISRIWGERFTKSICPNICVLGDILDVVTLAIFHNEILGVAILQAVKISLLIFDGNCNSVALLRCL